MINSKKIKGISEVELVVLILLLLLLDSLAKGQTVEKAVALAKKYVHAGVKHALSFD